MTGRPTDFSEEMAIYICSEIAAGRSLRSICNDDGMPDKSTVFRWLAKHETFRDNYAKAQEDRTAAFAEEIVEISDGDNMEDVQRAKLRVDTRKWLMSKMAPKRFGEKVTHAGDAEEPINHQHRFQVEFIGPQKD